MHPDGLILEGNHAAIGKVVEMTDAEVGARLEHHALRGDEDIVDSHESRHVSRARQCE